MSATATVRRSAAAAAPAAAVLLIDPKYPHNVGGALRACALFDAPLLAWTTRRVSALAQWPEGQRLPREHRHREYAHVTTANPPGRRPLEPFIAQGYTPVAVEVRGGAETLGEFIHPERALYVFGPEDGSLTRGVLGACHRFVWIPALSCLNLAAAVNVVLYDRARQLAQLEQRSARAALRAA